MKEMQGKNQRATISSKTIKKVPSPMKPRQSEKACLSKIRRLPFNKLKKRNLLFKKDKPFLYKPDVTSTNQLRLLPLKFMTDEHEGLSRTLSKMRAEEEQALDSEDTILRQFEHITDFTKYQQTTTQRSPLCQSTKVGSGKEAEAEEEIDNLVFSDCDENENDESSMMQSWNMGCFDGVNR